MQNYDKSIGARLRALRKEKNLNQTELATLLGKSLRTVQKYENGDIEISLANINDIAKKLDTTATYLLGYQQDDTPLTGYLNVFETMFKLEEMADLGFRIEVKRPPKHDKWECSIVFDGKDKNFDLNADMCLFLEDWKERRKDEDLQNPSQSYTRWKDQTLAYTITADTLAKEQEEK
ncbi:helix-turn-helix transcriptional regulator [Eubacterium sp. 1001713B170207_170306_E7]|uniref:helix-turn-helix domain-containing protein n=1 Tax=Eubacterium sp. 1001713B170207_170306_E7 TaxID=2787097 RepID=UPI00189BE8E3|nr:helix-turn-helix transcriptional regulator [Eubacterium sp. 1001713B170207_170306_E7]